MATRYCYGRITHKSYMYNDLKFESIAERSKFEKTFAEYHESHDHEGEVPIFDSIKRAEIRKFGWDIPTPAEVTIDGFKWHEINDFHNREFPDTYTHYSVPTCCVHPLISLEHGKTLDSGTLQRHALSDLFANMPADDFAKLCASIETNGFVDPVIRMHEGKILDGWHRYQAALHLNLVRKLMFRKWDEEEGDPTAFVLARNMNRRHLDAGQRAQIAVTVHQRFGHGGDRSKETNVHLKTQAELAEEAQVSTKTIQRAAKVEDAGQAEAVIAGEKTAGEVLKEQKITDESKPNAKEAMWDAFHDKTEEIIFPADWETRFTKAVCEAHPNWGISELPNPEDTEPTELWEHRFNLLTQQIENGANWVNTIISEFKDSESDKQQQLSKGLADQEETKAELTEQRQLAEKAEQTMWEALSHIAPDWNRDDFIAAACDQHNWGVTEFPDIMATDTPTVWHGRFNLLKTEIQMPTAWIQQMLDLMNEPVASDEEKEKALWSEYHTRVEKFKEKYTESGYKENDLIQEATDDEIITAFRIFREKPLEDSELTLSEIKDINSLLKSQSYPLSSKVRHVVNARTQPPMDPPIHPTEFQTQPPEPPTANKEATDEAERTAMAAAGKKMWQALWAKQEQVHAQNFITAACTAHKEWGVTNFPKNEQFTDEPAVWTERYDRITAEIKTDRYGWVTKFINSEYSELGADRIQPKSEPEVLHPEDMQEAQEVEEPIHYITIAWGADPTEMVMFNSDERNEKTPSKGAEARRTLSEIPQAVQHVLLQAAKTGELTGKWETQEASNDKEPK